MTRKTMTVEQWIKLIEEFESSGMEQRACAEKAGTNYSALKYWLDKGSR